MLNDVVTDPARRHDFVLLFDVQDGNPNGDPDAGNMPRVDPQTMQGITTDVCLKRKVRDWVDATHGEDDRYKIYVQRFSYLYDQQKRAYIALKIDSKDSRRSNEAGQWMCANFYDIRMFGAVMSLKEYNAGQVRGPVQLTFARSIDPVTPMDLSITRVALTKPGDRPDRAEADDDAAPTHGTMGRKALLPYGLYRGHGFFTPHFAKQTGATREDLDLFWRALVNMWDLDHSSSRGMQACRGLYVFSHESPLGNAPAHVLFDRVRVPKSANPAPREFSDYAVGVDDSGLAEMGVTLTRVIG
jgi:CRISPR-associated protein Csd2